MPESAPPAIEIIDLPTTSAEEARQKAERAKARLQKPAEPVQAAPQVQAPAPPAPAPAPSQVPTNTAQAGSARVYGPPPPPPPIEVVAERRYDPQTGRIAVVFVDDPTPSHPENVARQEIESWWQTGMDAAAAGPTGRPLAGLTRDAQPRYESPVTLAKIAVASNLATSPTAPETVRGIAAMGADDETQRVLAAQTELRQAGRSRAAQFLAQRGYEEQVSLLPDGIDLSATRKKMEAYGLQQEAKKLGFNNWFEVPQGDERTEAMKDVARRVEMDLARATTVGRGAIFIDPDPAGLRELVGALPLTTGQKMLAGALVPTAKATYSPTGSEFQTESPLAFPMRIVNAVGASVTTPVEAALTEAEPMRRISESRAKVEAGEISHGEYLSDLNTIARDAIKAATGMDLADGVDWRDAFARDPEVQKRLYDRMQTDPAAFMVANQLADDLVEYFDAPSTLTHLLLVPTGFAVDVVTPDPATPMLGLAAQAAKAGARLSGDSNDLLKAARALRAGAAEEGADLGRVMGAARENYNGLEEALAIRVGSRARVPTEVAAQVRRLEMEADEAAQAVQRAQERAAGAIDEQERFAATLDVLTTQQAAARARLDLAEAQAALADDANDIYKTVGAPAVKKSERLLKASEDARAEARSLEDEVAALQQENELGLGRLQAQNEALHEAMLRRDEAAAEVRAAQEALQQARAAKKAPAATVPEEVASLEAQVTDAKKALDRETAELAEQRKRLAAIQKGQLSTSTTPDPFSPDEIAETARVLKRRLRAASTVEDIRTISKGGTSALAEHLSSTSADPALRLIASRLGKTRVRVTLSQRAEGTVGAAQAALVRARAAAIDPDLDVPELGWVLHPKGEVVPHIKLRGGEVTELHVPVPVGATRVPDEILVHELVHVETAELLRAPIGTLTPTQQAARADLNTLYQHAKATLPDAGMDTYGLSSVDEFAAEALSNPAFQGALRSIAPPPGFSTSAKSGWSAFIDSLARLLGFGDEPSVLSEVSVALDRMMAGGVEVGAATRKAADEDVVAPVLKVDEPPTTPEPPPVARAADEVPPATPEPAPVAPVRGGAERIAEAKAAVEAQKARVAQRRADYDLLIEQRTLAREQQAKEAAAARVNAQVEAGAAQQRLDAAKAKVAAVDEELRQVNKTRQRALQDVEKPLAAMKARADRALEMHRRAAELEQESAEGIRLITTGTDIPGERGAVADVGARVAAMREAAQRELAQARDAFRQADSAANRGSRAAARAAEDEIRRIEGMMGAQMRADLLRERATLWREEARALADDIENGVAGLRSRRKVDPRHNGILMGTVRDEGRNGYLIDADAFRAKVEQEYSPEAVRWWVERAGDDRDLWVRALGLDGRGMTVLTKREALLLQQGEKGLLTGLERTRPAAAAEAQVEALLLLRRDPARKAAAFFDTNPKAWGEYIGNSLDTWVRALDPTAARIGEVNADVEQISRAANRMASNARDELLMLNRLAKLPQGFQASMRGFGSPQAMIDISLRYIDSTEPLEVFGRHTILNTGDETLWQRAKRQFQTDPRVATHDQMVQYAQSQGLSLEEMLASDQPGISNRPLLGLSRMWLKSGTGASERQSAYLFGEARRLIATSNSYQEFSDAMGRATQRAWTDTELVGGGGFGPGAIEVHPQRAIGYGARNVAQAAVQGDVNDLFVRGLGGIFTPDEANDAIKAATYNFDTIADPGNVWQTYARLGAPYTQRSLRDAESAVARTQALLQTGTTRSGEPVFMLSSQARALDETLDKVVKETHAQYAGARDLMSAWNLKHIGDFQQFWKTSVTLGLIVPRPSYFMTNIFGNFSQMWLSAGLGTAARISFQSLPFNIPFVGPAMDKAMRMTSERLGNVPHLGSITNAWVNPHINRVFAGEQGLFRAKNGIEYDFETVRKWMVEDGVMTSFMQEEFGRLFARAQGDGMMTRLSFLQDDIFSWAGEIELRMRAALYMDMLRKGATRGEAREVTLRALYDWEGALGKTEAQVFTWFIPFYRFIKLGLRQWGQEAISLPLRRPIESTYKAAMGQSGLARVNQQMKVTTFPELADDGDYQDDQQKWDAMSRYRNLDYLNKRVYWAERNDLELQALYQGTRGQFMPYSMTALPGLTALDMGALAVLPFYALGAVGLKATTLTGRALGQDTPEFLAPDWGAAFLDAALGMQGPITQPLIASWGKAAGLETQSQGEAVRMKPGEAAVANFPFRVAQGIAELTAEAGYRAQQLGLPAHIGKDYQRVEGTPVTKALVGAIPGVLQVPAMLDAFAYENPYVDNLRLDQDDPQGPAAGIANYFAFGARQWSGAGRKYPFNPETVVTYRQRDVGAEMRKVAERQGATFREKQLPKP